MKPRAKPVVLRKPTRFPADRDLTGVDVARQLSLGQEFEQYRFVGCDLSGLRLAGMRFADCLFEQCNLSMACFGSATLQNVAFAECKLMGATFIASSDLLFGVHFDHCQLRYAAFGGKQLAGTRFFKCGLSETDFTNSNLSGAVFDDCDLTRAVFHNSRLVEADFSTATGYSIDPEANILTGARFALAGLPGLLDKYGLVVA